MTQTRRSRPNLGFTLIEVLVALGIASIALVAGLQATAALTTNAARQSDMLLAQLCAENELTRVRLLRQLPGVGEVTASCQQGTESFDVVLAVATTPNPNFRRVDAQVQRAGQPLLRLSTVVGRL